MINEFFISGFSDFHQEKCVLSLHRQSWEDVKRWIEIHVNAPEDCEKVKQFVITREDAYPK